MADFIYNQFKHEVMEGTYDLSNGGDTIKVALMKTGHSASTSDDDDWTSVSANELDNGNGYTTGGATLANQATSVDDTDNEGVFDADDVTWSSATFTAYNAVLYDDTEANKALICSIDFGGAKTATNGDFVLQWDSEGIINIT